MIEKNKIKLTDWEKKEKRRRYMREYYLKRKYQLREGRHTIKKKPIQNTFKITRGIFIVRFD